MTETPTSDKMSPIDLPMVICGERRVPLSEVTARAERAAAGFAALGLSEGDTIALLLRNDIAFLEASLAAVRLGAYAVPINWHSTAEEVGYILDDSEAKVLVAHSDLLQDIEESVPSDLPVLVVKTPSEILAAYGLSAETDLITEKGDGRSENTVTLWQAWADAYPPIGTTPPPVRASMIYTSGTTGRPKGVRRKPMGPEMDPARAELLGTVFGIGPGMRTVITGTLYHSAPNAYALAAVRAEATIILQPRFDPEQLLAMIAEHRISHMHMVPTMFVRLLRLHEAVRDRYDLSSLRWIIHGAAPCSPAVKRAMIDWWGPVIYEYYGSTEAGLNTCISSKEWLARPGSVGRPALGTKVRILDDDDRVLPAGEIGQVYVRQELLSDFTYHRQDDKRRGIDRDGFVSVGDVGILDEEGYLFLRDRKIDMIISGGVNIYPAEIEGVLLSLDEVRDCAVFGIPDEEFGESVMAVVQPNGGQEPNVERIKAQLREHLAGFKVPRTIEFREELPREDSGKIFKRKLREPYWAGRESQI